MGTRRRLLLRAGQDVPVRRLTGKDPTLPHFRDHPLRHTHERGVLGGWGVKVSQPRAWGERVRVQFQSRFLTERERPVRERVLQGVIQRRSHTTGYWLIFSRQRVPSRCRQRGSSVHVKAPSAFGVQRSESVPGSQWASGHRPKRQYGVRIEQGSECEGVHPVGIQKPVSRIRRETR